MAVKLSSIIQYVFIGVVAYVFAGAPLLRFLTGSSEREPEAPITFKKIESLVIPEDNLTCQDHAYQVHVFSRDPLVIYIQSFLSDEEAKHLVNISEPKFKPSTIWNGGVESLDTSVRRSEKAELDRDDTVKCIEERARVFQGWRPNVFIEKLWSQRYVQNGFYRHHYDWASATADAGRVSSFMVYLEADCTGGGTNFPRLKVPPSKRWCEFVECDGEDEGVTFKPIKGNAVFWENVRPDGTGYEECWHAGLPVKTGTKIGLNIWSWYQRGYNP